VTVRLVLPVVVSGELGALTGLVREQARRLVWVPGP